MSSKILPPNPQRRRFGKNLVQLREALGLTQESLASEQQSIPVIGVQAPAYHLNKMGTDQGPSEENLPFEDRCFGHFKAQMTKWERTR